jgi:VCBS repeat-containing protein
MANSPTSRLLSLAAKLGISRARRFGSAQSRKRLFRLELLETRQLMAGDIAGTVFNDANANGIDESTENGLSGWTVFVDTNGNSSQDAGEPFAVTDEKGKFLISGLPAVSTKIIEIPQAGFSPTPGFSTSQTITVREGREVKVKFPNVSAPVATGQVVGTVYEDANLNGVLDLPAEEALEGWTVFIDANNNATFDVGEPIRNTNADGSYAFSGVPTGTATIYEVPQDGMLPVVPGLFPLTGALDFRTVTVTTAAPARADFANGFPSVGTIQGNVWNDANGDGIRGAAENGIAGVTIYVDVNSNNTNDAGEPTRMTDANGAYSFTGIRSGVHKVVEVVPASFIAAEGKSSSVLVSAFSGGISTVDFFNLTPVTGSVQGVLWNDANGNGLQETSEARLSGWTVYVDVNRNGVLDGTDIQDVTTAVGGYTLAGVAYGTNIIREVVPANFVATNPAAGSQTIKLLNGENRNGVSFGNREKIGTIQGTIWNDADGDRIRDTAEGALSGWTVFLDVDGNGLLGETEPTTTTGSLGTYTFDRVPVGAYVVTEVVPAGWMAAEGKPIAVPVALVIGATQVVDFYNLEPVPGTVSGVIFNDADLNGIQAATEPVMAGWQVYVDVNNNGSLDAGEPSAISGADGVYTVSGVGYGTNVLREVVQPGFKTTNYLNGTTTLFMFNGENRTGVSFGNHEPAEFVISGAVFFDANHNGAKDIGERGLSGITVYLDSNNNGSPDAGEPTTVTSADLFFTPGVNEAGNYAFTHLVRGNYQVREVVPVDLGATAEAARLNTVAVGPLSANDVNFANVYRPNEIHGVVFDDTDDDGVYDASEYARPGVGVYIDLNRDDIRDPDEPSTTTSGDGSYSFVGLTPGAYIVREYSGLAGPHTYPNTTGGILLPPGVSNPSQGLVSPGSISINLSDGQLHTQTVSLTLPGTGGITNMVDVFLLFDDTGSFTSNSPIVRTAFPTIISNLQTALPSMNFGFGVGRLEEYGSFAAENASGRPFILNQPIVASSTTGFSTAIQAALDRTAPGYGGDQPETDIEALYQVVTGLGFDGNNNGSVLDSGPAGLASTQLTPGASGDVPSFASFRPDPTNNVIAASGSIGGAGFRPGALPVILTATDTGFAYQPKGETNIVGTGGFTLPLSSLTQTSRGTTPFGYGAGIQETVTGLNALGALVIGLGTNPGATLDPRQGLESLAKLTGAVNTTTETIANGTTDPIAPGDPFYFQISSGFGSTVANGITSAIQNAVTNVALDITVQASDPRVRIINHTGTALGVGAGQTASFDIEFVGDGKPHRFDLQFVRAGTNVVVGSIPVVIGTPITGDYYSYDELEDGEVHHSSHFGNYVANEAPTFIVGVDQSIQEDAGAQTIASWATSISPGPATESRQTVSFNVTNSNPSLFSTQPTVASDGTLTFTPAANASGSVIVSVQAQDSGGKGRSGVDVSAVQTFRIDIAPVVDAPVAIADSYSMDQDGTLTIAAVGLLANDTDGDGDALTAQLSVGPAHGTVTLNADGSFVYTPSAGYIGADSFSYIAKDAALESNIATVSITVNRINHAPIAVADAYTTNQNIPLNVLVPGLLGNDADVDGDAITATLVTGPAHGSLTVNTDGTFLYTPTLNYSGADSFTYQASDGLLSSSEVMVDINVISTNTAPVTNDDSFSTNEDTLLSIAAPGVIANDTDADGNTLTASIVSLPLHGILSFSANGSLLYTPTLNYNGPDSFSYRVSDGILNSNVAIVAIDVVSVNDAPVAVANSYSTNEDVTLTVAAPGVLGNDTDVEGDVLVPSLVTGPTRGTLTFNANGSFTYVPNANANGVDSFTYRVNDGTADSAVATVVINVVSVNDVPVAVGENYSTNEDSNLTIAAPGVLANDSDLESTLLSAAVVTAPLHGTLTLNANGSFVYRPTANYSGPDSFTYRVNDGAANSNVATVAISVAAINDAPVAVGETYSTTKGIPLTVAAPGVLGNDADADGDVITAIVGTGPTNGTLSLNANGSLTYTPNSTFTGIDSFTYTATDATLQSAQATVTITVLAPPSPGPKFFVVDGANKGTFKYAAEGTYMASHLLNKADSKPRGIASNPAGTIQWVIDGGGTVFVYDNIGTLLGSWVPSNAGKPEGITVWGNDLWLVDPNADRVQVFVGGANLRSGRVGATSSFQLNAANLDSTDIVTDGTHLWVLNNTATSDKVFRYLVNGTLEGSWTLSATNPTPTGITLDPTNVNHLWIVDASTDRVLQYSGSTTRLTGAQEPDLSFALNANNSDPQGIADPLVFSRPVEISSIVSVAPTALAMQDSALQRRHAVDSAFASWCDDEGLSLVGAGEAPAVAMDIAQAATIAGPIATRRASKSVSDLRTIDKLSRNSSIDAAFAEVDLLP